MSIVIISKETLPDSPKEFFDKYLTQRKPIIMKQCSNALVPKLHSLSCETLQSLVDNDKNNNNNDTTMIEVNEKSNKNQNSTSFSPKDDATVKTISWNEFLQSIRNQQSKYYMTTQTLPVNEEGRPAIYTSTISKLINEQYIPRRLPILGNLIPMNINLWMGYTSSTPTSSGLHHDFHDNLYIVIHGTKTFEIAPPNSIYKFTMSGTVCKVHDNGRIVYQEQINENNNVMIRPDGAIETIEQLVQWEIEKENLELKLNDTTDTNQQESLEEKINDLEEKILDFEMDQKNRLGGENKNSIDDEDDVNNDDNSNSEDNDNGVNLFGASSTINFPEKNCQQFDSEDDSDKDATSPNSSKNHHNNDTEKNKKEVTTMTLSLSNNNNDSCIGNPPTKKQKVEKLPVNFVVAGQDQVPFETLTLKPGDMLWLPAGWFHNVSSHGGLHMALNYWTHPMDVKSSSFEQPYISKFWQRDWDARNFC